MGGAPAANAVAHFERFFDHGEMDPKWEGNPSGRDRYKAYLAIAAGKRTDREAGDTIPFGDVHVDVVASTGAVLMASQSTVAAPPNPLLPDAEAKAPNKTENSQYDRRARVVPQASRFSTSAI